MIYIVLKKKLLFATSFAAAVLKKTNRKNNRRGINSHWRRSGEVGFPEIALSKLFVVKSTLISLKNNRQGAYFCKVA